MSPDSLPKFKILPAKEWKGNAPELPVVVPQSQEEAPAISPVTGKDIFAFIQRQPELQGLESAICVNITTAHGNSQQAKYREQLIQELDAIATRVTNIRDGKLQLPKLEDFFKAQQTPGQEALREITTEALQCIIARELSPNGNTPERNQSTKTRVGHEINVLLENTGLEPDRALELLKLSIERLNRTEEVTLYHLIGTGRKFDLDFPDTDICTEEEACAYFRLVINMDMEKS